MKKQISITGLAVLMLVWAVFLSAEVKNSDTPSKGEFTFKISKIWELESAREDIFAGIRQLLVSGEDTLYIYDNKNMKYYIINKKGQFSGAFGKKGEGPGEIRRILQAPMFLAGNQIAVQDLGRLHFFDKQGKYIKTVLNNHQRRRPVFFLNENEFVSSPRTIFDVTEGKGKIRLINLKTNQEKVITEFSVFESGTIQSRDVQAAVVSVALTPIMIMGCHGDQLYFGMNDRYKISIAQLDGKIINTFSLERKRRHITDKVKKDRLIKRAKGRAPVEVLEMLAKKMPNDLTYFSTIEVHNGLIYVFTSYYGRKNTQQIDIFTPGGNYLYRSFITVAEDNTIIVEPLIKNGHLYLVLENEEGEQSVGKYELTLPTN